MEEDHYGYDVAITIFMVLIAGIIAIIINYTNGALNNFLINLSRSWIWYFMGCAILNRLILEVLKIIITNLKTKIIIISLLYLINFFLVEGVLILTYVQL